MSSLDAERYSRRGGTGGENQGYELVTHGKVRVRVRADGAVLLVAPDSTTPAAPIGSGAAILFSRDDGAGKAQLCVRYPSGAIQILATEP